MRLAQLEIPAKAEFVSLARMVVSSIVDDRYDIESDKLGNLKLALSEACAMAIDADAGEGNILVECIGNRDRVDVVVNSPGSFLDHDYKDNEDRKVIDHELGFPLIGSLVDDMNFDDDGAAKNVIRMVVYCHRAELL